MLYNNNSSNPPLVSIQLRDIQLAKSQQGSPVAMSGVSGIQTGFPIRMYVNRYKIVARLEFFCIHRQGLIFKVCYYDLDIQ
jgi:hypothetical protein